MFRNYIKTTVRNLSRNKVFSFINLLGLSVGLACCMLIFLYAKDEVSYDRFHEKGERIFRITADMKSPNGNVSKNAVTGMVPGPAFSRSVPEIETYVRLQEDVFVAKKGTEVFQQPVQLVDSNFFSVFSFPLIEGNPRDVLHDPYAVVLSEEAAKKYFGTTKAIGKTVELKTDSTFRPFTVTGIAKKAPQNSSIKFEMLLPMSFRRLQGEDKEWLNFFLNTFVVLPPGADTKKVEAKMAQVFQKEARNQLKEAAEKYGMKETFTFGLQPFTDIHLSKEYGAQNGMTDASNPMYSYILSGIALFIFLIACINFINLTVAQSLKRAKEIGIRKVMGSQRRQLIAQFLGESFVLSFLAFILAIGLVQLLLAILQSVSQQSAPFFLFA
jgi:putative ABC transport system permease protein